MLFAVATIIGHNSMPHHHHTEIQLLTHHNDHHNEQGTEADHHDQEQNKEDHHNIFSFAQLDEDFVPPQFSKVNIDLPILYLLTSVITYQFNKLKEKSKTHFGYYREFPPPDNYSSNLFSRPPPAC
jgi:hypothetical protein